MKVPVDYFGVAGNALIQRLLNESSNKRDRKVAFNDLVRMAKAVKTLPKNATVVDIGVVVAADGTQNLLFREGVPTDIGASS